MKRFALTVGSIVLVLSAGLATVFIIKSIDSATTSKSTQTQPTPELTATKLVGDLEHPWDIDFLPDGTLLFSERSGSISLLEDGAKQTLETPDDVVAAGEGGMLGIAVDPLFSQNRYMYACFNTKDDIVVARWSVSADRTRLQERKNIITGIPAAASGRHSGCQLAFGPDKNLWVATGDSADENQPQNTTTLGGKILRVDREGAAVQDNPVGPDRRVYSYGHRNLQALAFYSSQKDESYGLSVEHGPDKDDEVNELEPGNFGWAPGAEYDESVPMTDIKNIPDAIASVWSSGYPTIAPSGAAILQGNTWGRFKGWLALSVLKDKKLLLLNVMNGSVSGERTFLDGEYGRLRAATLGPDGALYVSTDNGSDDMILRITPQ